MAHLGKFSLSTLSHDRVSVSQVKSRRLNTGNSVPAGWSRQRSRGTCRSRQHIFHPDQKHPESWVRWVEGREMEEGGGNAGKKQRDLLCSFQPAVLSHFNCVWLFSTLWTVACQAPLSMGILQARILDGLLYSPPGDLPNPWIKPRSPLLQEDTLLSEPPGKHKNIGMGSLSLIQRNFLPKNWTGVSCIAGRFFTSWGTRKAQEQNIFTLIFN